MSESNTENTRPVPANSGNQAAAHHPARELMPYGSVLVVDDMQSNLFVIKKLLTRYKLNTDVADSGFAAIEKIENGGVYDIIFMDYKIPRMNGLETTQKLRAMGYRGVILAMTADVPPGGVDVFIRNGLDGFISKPIDIAQMETVLYMYIRDRHPEEAQKYKAKTPIISNNPLITPELLRIFCCDAQSAIEKMSGAVASGDIKRYTITVHAMKSALASMGETDASEQARLLERAGISRDTDYIAANTDRFIGTLKSLIERLQKLIPADYDMSSAADVSEHGDDVITFLLVDDSRFMRGMIKNILAQYGYKVVGEASNGADGFAKFIELEPDIVTLDHNMDDVTGLEALELIKDHKPDANVIMISGMMGQGIVAREALDKGAKAIISKPVDEKELLKAIHKIFPD